MRSPGTTAFGGGFNDSQVVAVWNKGRPVEGFDPRIWRYDCLGNPIKFSEHGNTNSEHGWEIDHIKPVARDGTDDLLNLQPLQWHANRTKGDQWPWP